MEEPRRLMAIGICLMIVGVALPFLMVIKLLESTLYLSFLSYGCSLAGFITGFIGITRHVRSKK